MFCVKAPRKLSEDLLLFSLTTISDTCSRVEAKVSDSLLLNSEVRLATFLLQQRVYQILPTKSNLVQYFALVWKSLPEVL
jgi:hypothetical protein